MQCSTLPVCAVWATDVVPLQTSYESRKENLFWCCKIAMWEFRAGKKKKKDLSGEKRKAVQKRTCKLEEWIRSAEFLWPKAKNESDLPQPSKRGFQRSGASDLLPCEKLDWDGENGNSECDYEVCKQLAKGKQERPKRKWGLGAFASGISYVSVLQLNRVNFFRESLKHSYCKPGIDEKLRSTDLEKVQDTDKKIPTRLGREVWME